eukprot:1826636-Prymnesium_polylepis.1
MEPLQRLEIGVEEALCEIFGSAEATTSKAVVGTLAFLEPDDEESGGSTPLRDQDDALSMCDDPAPTGGMLWADDADDGLASVVEDDVKVNATVVADSAAARVKQAQLSFEQLEQSMSSWPAASDGVGDMVSLGDLIGSLDAPARAPAPAPAPAAASSAATNPAAAEGASGSNAPNRKEWAASEDEAIRKG